MREDNHSYTLLMQLRKETMPEKINSELYSNQTSGPQGQV